MEIDKNEKGHVMSAWGISCSCEVENIPPMNDFDVGSSVELKLRTRTSCVCVHMKVLAEFLPIRCQVLLLVFFKIFLRTICNLVFTVEVSKASYSIFLLSGIRKKFYFAFNIVFFFTFKKNV